MHYEIHITVEAPDLDSFKDACQKLEVKPIIIETQSRNNSTTQQVMTSSKHNDDVYLDKLIYLSYWLTVKGFKVIRRKVEIQAKKTKHKHFIYYESHLRLKLQKDFDMTPLASLCETFDFHISKNLFKTDKDFNYQMITFRNNSLDYELFIEVIDMMKSELDELGVVYDKVEIEECIFDSNETIDKAWLGNQ